MSRQRAHRQGAGNCDLIRSLQFFWHRFHGIDALAAAVHLAALVLASGCASKPTPLVGVSPSSADPAEAVPLGGVAAPAIAGRNVPAIKVDSVGYPSAWAKHAVVNVLPSALALENLRSHELYAIASQHVFSFGRDPASQDEVWQVDFSEFSETGEYRLVNDALQSQPFAIGDDIYAGVLVLAQRAFYFQRARSSLQEPHAVWQGARFVRAGKGHDHQQVGWKLEDHPEKLEKRQVAGGWYEGPSFDMYVPSTALVVHGLLTLYERFPGLFADGDLPIPESDNQVPDLIDEVLWGVRWLLSMQDEDGGFRVREASERAALGSPGPADQDKAVRWVDRVASASTAKGCAAAAVASRVLRAFDPKLSLRAEQASSRAWYWLLQHPQRVVLPDASRVLGELEALWDESPEGSDAGARLLAAAEMWRTFRIPGALPVLAELMGQPEASEARLVASQRDNPARLALLALAYDTQIPYELSAESKRRLLSAAGSLPNKLDGYYSLLSPEEYGSGSNALRLERAELMFDVARLDPEVAPAATQIARHQWHWIMGRNPNGFSMVTGVGKGPEALCHPEWGPRSPALPPGYLVAGPNHQGLPFLAPEAPAKALLWESPHRLQSGTAKGSLWHWARSDLREAGFLSGDELPLGWCPATGPSIYYNMLLVRVAAEVEASLCQVLPRVAP